MDGPLGSIYPRTEGPPFQLDRQTPPYLLCAGGHEREVYGMRILLAIAEPGNIVDHQDTARSVAMKLL